MCLPAPRGRVCERRVYIPILFLLKKVGIYFTQVAPTGCGTGEGGSGAFDHGFVWDGFDGDRLLYKSVEKLPPIC